MSWMKRGQTGAGPGPQPYAAPQPQAQPFGNQQNAYTNYPSGTGPGPAQQPPQQFWQTPPQYPPDASQNYPPPAPPAHNQEYHHNYYHTPPAPHAHAYAHQQNVPTGGGAWEDNWDWGWDEAANKTQPRPPQPPAPRHSFDNANVIEESFVGTDTWSWPADHSRDNGVPAAQSARDPPAEPTPGPAPPEHNHVDNRQPARLINTLSDREAIEERLPNLALGKRFNLDNLTPQWSIESQMSQESSDGPQTHSEGTYRSENRSMDSISPGPNTDHSNYNYARPGSDETYTRNSEWSKNSDEGTVADDGRSDAGAPRDALADSIREMSIAEHPAAADCARERAAVDARSAQEDAASAPSAASPPSVSAAAMTIAPPPPAAALPLPRPPSSSSTSSLSGPAPQPLELANSQNPFQRAPPFSHTSSAKELPPPFHATPAPPAGLASPHLVNKSAQPSRAPVGFEANLETTPDNSERPDQPPAPLPHAPRPRPQPPPDNMEVAPQHDRNEYLQTAHLSGGDYGSPPPPLPPGLRRMVVGRGGCGEREEPPPGLARMVPAGADEYRDRRIDGRPTAEPYRAPRPPAFDRMVPGEPSDADYPQYRVVTGLERGPPPPPAADDAQRELTVEGENLQDPAEPPPAPDRHERARHTSSGDDGERERGEEGRRSRGERGYERERDDRREGGDARKQRRSARARRYDTEDTDYYSDRERRSYREGSYTSKPPRGERRGERRGEQRGEQRGERRHERHYHTIERERPRDDRRRDRHRDADADRDRDRDRYVYRDIDPSRKYGNLRREREEDERRRGEPFSSASRPESREAPTDEDGAEGRRPAARRRPRPRRHDPYYDAGYGAAGYADPYLLQRQQYEYYEQLRLTDPAAYLLVYNQLMAGRAPPLPHLRAAPEVGGYAPPGYGARAEERGSVHSGRSSANGLKGNDTFSTRGRGAASPRGAPSPLSDRDLNTDASLNLQLDASTVRSERMTPCRFSTAHVKGSIGSRDIVLVPAAYPVDGRPATVQVLSLAAACAADPDAAQLLHSPGPLLKGVTHKKSVIEYCMLRVRAAATEGARDVTGYALLWELLALMLRQNGVVVGSDIAELLMKSVREHEPGLAPARHDSRRGSSMSGSLQEEPLSCATPPLPAARRDGSLADSFGTEPAALRPDESAAPRPDERAALDQFREHLLYGNRQEALECAMAHGLWGHALQLALAGGDRRARAAVSARFLAAVPRADPLHTLYAALAGAQPPAASARRGEWRAHAAVLLANASLRPERDARTLTALGDTLAARGLPYCAQVCYLCAGVPFAPHPLAPLQAGPPPAAAPRLSLLLAEPGADSLRQLATPRAILATETYEYARSLAEGAGGAIPSLQVYKLVAACRLVDAGRYARALGYVEAAARGVAAAPAPHAPALARALHALGERLRAHDPPPPPDDALDADAEPQHQHQWLDDLARLAHHMQAGSAPPTPQHAPPAPPQAPGTPQHEYSWSDQTQHYQQSPNQTYAEPELAADSSQYYQPPAPPAPLAPLEAAPDCPPEPTAYVHDGWGRAEDAPPPAYAEPYAEPHAEPYAEPYWHGDAGYYGETAAGEAARPTITMPGAARPGHPAHDDDRPPSAAEQPEREADGGGQAAGGKAAEGQKDGKGRSWIGGILTKLSLRPPNQMILPDDKNPTIVWDAAKQRWCDKDGGEGEGPGAGGAPPPPPTARDLAHALRPPNAASPPLPGAGGAGAGGAGGAAPVANIFKMQKGRHIKKSYVDVFNPGGTATPPAPPGELLPPAPPLAPPNNYFVPAPQGGMYEAAEDEQYRSGI